ncbi:MAG: cold shock domain-containing protein [Planctomycetes bacterium]|nr:cold shock domain-containing protein [Planctomycetota bacterium]NOG55743.1 cold shock domain-containing protein [Planctomycetota bacterium]
MTRVESNPQVLSEPQGPTTHGKIKWFDSNKGYGFIIGPEDQDILVHYSVIEMDGFRTLKDGSSVEYTVEARTGGLLRATWVRPVCDE